MTTKPSATTRITLAILGFQPDDPFSVTDVAVMASTSKETVRQVFHALKTCRFIRYKGRGYAGRNWYRRPNALPPADEIVKAMLDFRREERQWLRLRSTSTSKSVVSLSQSIAS